jgi:nucleotide-binding universal stress UspA family protein
MKILLPVNDSRPSRAAADFIGSHTTLAGSDPKVVLINVQWPLSTQAVRAIGVSKARSVYRHDADVALKTVQKRLAGAGIKAPARIALGNAGECIAAAADKIKADLIVMGARGLGAFKGMLFGSVTNAVLAHTQVPMLVLRERSRPFRVGESAHVGIALDGSKFGKAALRYVLKHRELFGAAPSFTLIHVAPDLVMPVIGGLGGAAAPVWSEAELKAIQDAAFTQALAPARAKLKAAGVTFDEARLIGMAGERIAEFAKKHRLDVLVLGSHGYGAFKGAVLGSVATHVADRCDTPLLLIRRA